MCAAVQPVPCQPPCCPPPAAPSWLAPAGSATHRVWHIPVFCAASCAAAGCDEHTLAASGAAHRLLAIQAAALGRWVLWGYGGSCANAPRAGLLVVILHACAVLRWQGTPLTGRWSEVALMAAGDAQRPPPCRAAGLITSTFWMPNSALNGFGQAARVFSGFFIVLQVCGAAAAVAGWACWEVARQRRTPSLSALVCAACCTWPAQRPHLR